jgi:hypothetical protein
MSRKIFNFTRRLNQSYTYLLGNSGCSIQLIVTPMFPHMNFTIVACIRDLSPN